jgi:hypothetical protein
MYVPPEFLRGSDGRNATANPRVVRRIGMVRSRNVALNVDLARLGVKTGPNGETAMTA